MGSLSDDPRHQINISDLACQFVRLITPCLLDLNKEGFQIYNLIVEVDFGLIFMKL